LGYKSEVRFYWLILGVLSVWRVTNLLVAEDGPWNMFARLRRRVGQGFFATLIDCFYCLSLWVSAPLAWVIGSGKKERVLLWLALSGGAILLHRVTERNETVPPALYYEDSEVEDGLLRKEQMDTTDRNS
jgi:hypothetical protein